MKTECWHCFKVQVLTWCVWDTAAAWLCARCWREQQRENRQRGAA